ncbi:unnamed protein product [Polarella glacialis]|uniref:Uncharacterized protein n=1 Tax=Polarella glacialis TaxID=89957 RepID=A0A813FMP9_POLGL|nr:unnamed protein product [Polarella glacialis]
MLPDWTKVAQPLTQEDIWRLHASSGLQSVCNHERKSTVVVKKTSCKPAENPSGFGGTCCASSRIHAHLCEKRTPAPAGTLGVRMILMRDAAMLTSDRWSAMTLYRAGQNDRLPSSVGITWS